MNDRFRFRFRFRFWNEQEKRYEDLGNFPNGVNEFFEFVEHKVEQCTGLKDNNGRLIYDGDIVKRISKHDEEEPTVSLQVEWNNKGGRYVTTDKKHSTWTFSMFDYFYEVIGNIHENPELLEGK